MPRNHPALLNPAPAFILWLNILSDNGWDSWELYLAFIVNLVYMYIGKGWYECIKQASVTCQPEAGNSVPYLYNFRKIVWYYVPIY